MLLAGVGGVAALVACAVPASAHDDPVDTTVYRVPVGSSPARGPRTAPVTIVEFADFQCPYCTRAEESLRQVSTHYGDKVRIVWKNFPLDMHKDAPLAHMAAMAADETKKRCTSPSESPSQIVVPSSPAGSFAAAGRTLGRAVSAQTDKLLPVAQKPLADMAVWLRRSLH